MQTVARTLVVSIAAAILLAGIFIGVRTAFDPVLLVLWRNRLNGDPRQYPVELRIRRWAQWNMTMWNLDHPRVAELRTFGIVVAVLNAILLTGLLLFTC